MTDWYTSEPMKYWAMPANYTQARRAQELQMIVDSGNYCFSQKWDGNWSRAIVGTNHDVLQTRGISKNTGTYGEVQSKVLWWNDVTDAFSKLTVILGEIYLDGGVDRDVGSILRCLTEKAIKRQEDKQLKWHIFDVLCYDGEDISNSPMTTRMQYINKVVERIHNPLVTGVSYYNVDNTFFDKLGVILGSGGEGVVMWRKDGAYQPGKRPAHLTCKVKKELTNEADLVCTGYTPAIRDYMGKNIETWDYWQNLKTGERVRGPYYHEYITNHAFEPVTKSYYYEWIGSIQCSAYDSNGKLKYVCDVSGITEELKEEIKQHPNKYIGCPLKVMAMEVTPDGSLRHPKFLGFRDDIPATDCTLEKIVGK